MPKICLIISIVLCIVGGQLFASADDSLAARDASWLEMMRDLIPRVGESEQESAFPMLVIVLVEAEQIAEAKLLTLQQEEGEVKNRLLRTLAQALAENAEFDEAFSVTDEIAEPAAKEWATYDIAIQLAKK